MSETELEQLVSTMIDELFAGRAPSPAAKIVRRYIEDAMAAERERCVTVCRERAALWRRTPAASSDIPAAREEARARANEAAYLADLLEQAMPHVEVQ
ncbi:MAG TPA: hypothetical protein VHK90_05740 [Thermoanaerobaculia bacterium]|nr:hypothetical protein [Thermoanaerobaculia bacterium]